MWEYLIEWPANAWAVRTTDFRLRLQALGEQGWELVAVDALGNLYFKRPKKNPVVA
jgi:hypothetical protein